MFDVSVVIWLCVQYLGEQPPPLPVPEFEVSSAVPLHDPQSAHLLLLLQEGSEK